MVTKVHDGTGSHDCHTCPYGLRQKRAFCDFTLLCFSVQATKNRPAGTDAGCILFPDLFGADFLPIPTANSSTHTPHFFATIKCPNSWTMTRTPITIKEIMIEESIPITSKNFYIKVLPPLHKLLPMRPLPADPLMYSFLLQYMPPLFFLSMQEYPKIQFCQTGILPQQFHWRRSAL